MRFRSVLTLLFLASLISSSSALAQKRILATVAPNAQAVNSSAEIYNPYNGSITPVANSMQYQREQMAVVELNGGKVLIAGGHNDRYLKATEIFNPADGSFTAAVDMNNARAGAVTARLNSGLILIAGGYNGSYLNSAELYDPSTNVFNNTLGSMTVARDNAVSALLQNGQVLIAGGFNSGFINTAELYDPIAGTFSSAANMTAAREGHTATLLPNGTVLITGGCNNLDGSMAVCDQYLNTAELYDVDSNTFAAVGNMTTARSGHTATLLPDGTVLIAGGKNASSVLSSAEIYDPNTQTFTAVGNMATERYGHTASLSNGLVLVAGGYSDHVLSSMEVYSNGSFSSAGQMNAPRMNHSSLTIRGGGILLIGGRNSDLMSFDVNYRVSTDNISPSVLFSSDSQTGFAPYPGSGVILSFSTTTGAVTGKVFVGGKPQYLTPLADGNSFAAVSVLDNKIFIVRMNPFSLLATYSFNGSFGFGSIPTLSPDKTIGYISSTGTGDVIKFDLSTGRELGRLSGLTAPAQITITKDGKTLFIVDTTPSQVVFADAGTMTTNYVMKPLDSYSNVSFTIYNKVVLSPDETYGVIGSQDAYGTMYVFQPSTGSIIYALLIGYLPGYTTLTPDGLNWVILCQNAIVMIPTSDVSQYYTYTTYQGNPLGSANIAITADSRYFYYTSSDADLFSIFDSSARAVSGEILVGDKPNLFNDQPSTLAITPDGKTIAVLNFESNELDLLVDSTLLRQTKFSTQDGQFTGISAVNLSNKTANLTITAYKNSGEPYYATDLVNPVYVQLGPNEQKSLDMSQLFDLTLFGDVTGRLDLESDQPVIAAFSATGTIKSSFMDFYTGSMQGIQFSNGLLHDFIVPELLNGLNSVAELNFVNPNYTQLYYGLTHYSADGSIMQSKIDQISARYRQPEAVGDFITVSTYGRVLIVGGLNNTGNSTTADVYDSGSKALTPTSGDPTEPREGATATLMADERVLIAGGKDGSTILDSADVYDPTQKTFLPAGGTMNIERYRHTATALLDGKILIAGGQDFESITNTAELFDSSDESFTLVGSMSSPRNSHTATRLADGTVLMVGGIDGNSISSTAEIYNPASASFSLTAARMSTGRVFHTAVLLQNGKVLIAGGFNGYNYLKTAELYDPATRSFSAVPSMIVGRVGHTATRLADGTVLIAGGRNESGPVSYAEIYDPALNKFTLTDGTMTSAKVWHTATFIPSFDSIHSKDRVLIAGGDDGSTGSINIAELYDPTTQHFTRVTDMNDLREKHAAVLLSGGTQGYLRMKATVGMLFSEIYNNVAGTTADGTIAGGANASLNGINMEKYVGIKKVYSPQFSILSNQQTLINVINGNQSNANITITMHKQDGSVLGTPYSALVAANGQIKGDLWQLFHNDSTLINQKGWVEVSSDSDSVVGTISFTDSNDDYLAAMELSGTPLKDFVIPLASNNSIYSTELSLLNAGAVAAQVTFELWGLTSGTTPQAVTNPVTLQPGRNMVALMSDLFPGVSASTANIRVHSTQPLHSFAIISDRQLRFMSSVPAIEIPVQ